MAIVLHQCHGCAIRFECGQGAYVPGKCSRFVSWDDYYRRQMSAFERGLKRVYAEAAGGLVLLTIVLLLLAIV